MKNLKQIRDNFVLELVQAAEGKKTSLAFIQSPLPRHNLVAENERFQVMVIGGSVFEQAIIQKQKGRIAITNLQKVSLPNFATKGDFFSFVTQYLNPKIRVLAINFAFPLTPVMRGDVLDGIYIGVAEKQHGFAGLRGKIVGEEVENYFKKLKKSFTVTVGHDLLCLAISVPHRERWERFVCGILGTGFNLGFFLDGSTWINLEAGRFDKFASTATGKIVDTESRSTGSKLFEKEVAGAYLYRHFNLLSPKSPLASTEELSRLAEEGNKTARELLERSASLVACQIAGIYRFKKQPRLTFVMEGSLFWQGWRSKEMVEEYVVKLGVPKEAIRFVEIENSAILGTASLVI